MGEWGAWSNGQSPGKKGKRHRDSFVCGAVRLLGKISAKTLESIMWDSNLRGRLGQKGRGGGEEGGGGGGGRDVFGGGRCGGVALVGGG